MGVTSSLGLDRHWGGVALEMQLLGTGLHTNWLLNSSHEEVGMAEGTQSVIL